MERLGRRHQMSVVFLTPREVNLFKQFKNGCENKVSYRSKERAAIAKAKVSRKAPRTGVATTRPYSCQFCGLWHLGHGE
jgi:hypothetical protein